MATAVVLTRRTVRQAIVLSGYGMVLGLLFLILQAPDVAMSQIGVGTVLLPLIVVLALHATRRYRDTATGNGRHDDGRPDGADTRNDTRADTRNDTRGGGQADGRGAGR
ncbi:DUF4040 domain-containing protein [Actinomadura spongiicola]|uniref:DUF4040 domain-containing protein n=2 Tax=Actinomadura spongiicola TaxID=2303421 RepID=A0A372GG42_9ACTN|nr:DUF4040 domain-containing protein [Actinomadura spongiicola]